MSIERIPPKPRHRHPELVQSLADALDPSRANDSGPGIPRIREIALSYGNALRIEVIWEKWEGVPHSERGPIILDAYQQKKGDQEMLRITNALGITPLEAGKLNIHTSEGKRNEANN